MKDQLPLPGFPETRNIINHLFFTIFPDSATAATIAQLATRLRKAYGIARGQLRTERFHVTLFSLLKCEGELPIHKVQAASRAASAISVPSFTVTFDRVMSFKGRPGNHPCVLASDSDNSALMEFHGRLGDALRKNGFSINVDKRFNPHVTLFYSNQSISEELSEPVSWAVNDFFLINSLQGLTRYEKQGSWAFGIQDQKR